MSKSNTIKRRNFVKMAAAAGVSSGLGACGSAGIKPGSVDSSGIRFDFLRVGMVGFSPYAPCLEIFKLVNSLAAPPVSNMRITALWAAGDNYRSLYRGDETSVLSRVNACRDDLAFITRTKEHLNPRIVKQPEDMVSLVDAVMIMDPHNSLSLAGPFIRARKPVYIASPIAWNMSDARAIVRLARNNNCPLITGSHIPWIDEIQVAASRIDKSVIQHFFIDGASDSFCTTLPRILETARMVVGGRVIRCSTHGMTWGTDEDPDSMTPVMVHLEYELMEDRTEPVVGVASTWYGEPNRLWMKVHFDRQAVEEGVSFEGDGYDSVARLFVPFLRMLGASMEQGVSPEDIDAVTDKVAVMLMAHKSGVSDSMPTERKDIGNHELPRFITLSA